MKFKQCTIIVENEKDKKEFLEMCRYLHDFTVWFKTGTKISISENMKKKAIKIKDKKCCGISLNFDKYKFLNFLVGLHECEGNFEYRDKFLKVKS